MISNKIKPHVPRNDRNETNLKAPGKTTTVPIATQDTIDKARNRAAKELGTAELTKIKLYKETNTMRNLE